MDLGRPNLLSSKSGCRYENRWGEQPAEQRFVICALLPIWAGWNCGLGASVQNFQPAGPWGHRINTSSIYIYPRGTIASPSFPVETASVLFSDPMDHLSLC